VNNDFHQTHNIFELFDGLTVPELNEPVVVEAEVKPRTNGVNGHAQDFSDEISESIPVPA
jgi:hypothetical protein